MKKRKGHSMNARFQRTGLASLKGLAVGFVCGKGGMVELLNIKSGARVKAGPAVVSAITTIPFRWSVYCAVMGRTETGQEYTKAFQVVTDTACTQCNPFLRTRPEH